MAEDRDTEARWYVVHTYSGYENKVAQNLETIVENRRLQELIHEVKVPVELVPDIKDGKEREVERKLFPGYVLVKMVMTDDSWYIVRNTRGVTGFVGPGRLHRYRGGHRYRREKGKRKGFHVRPRNAGGAGLYTGETPVSPETFFPVRARAARRCFL